LEIVNFSETIDSLPDLISVKYLTVYVSEENADLLSLASMPALEMLDILFEKDIRIYNLDACRNIKSLGLFYHPGIPEAPDISVLNFPPTLESLSIYGPLGVVYLADSGRLTNLTKVHFSNCKELRDLNTLFEMPNLKNVKIRDCGKIDVMVLPSNPELKVDYKA
jgi:hypothetical protein